MQLCRRRIERVLDPRAVLHRSRGRPLLLQPHDGRIRRRRRRSGNVQRRVDVQDAVTGWARVAAARLRSAIHSAAAPSVITPSARKDPFVLPVGSLSTPTTYGPTKPPVFPMAFTSAIAAAAALP